MEAFTFDTTEQILLAATGTLFIIQALYYLCLYNRIHLRSRAVKRGNVHFSQELPPVSVIICAREECENLRRNLKAVLEQDYPQFEVIVINDGNTDESEDYLTLLEEKYPHLYHSFVPDSSRYISRKKLAATLGVKASKYDWLVFTEANCCPQSNQWLRLLARNFTSRTQVVLGYSGYELGKGWLHKRVAFDNLFTSMRYLGFALAGSPYMGIGRNHADATVRMQPVFRAKDWREEKIGYASTARLYHGMQRWLAGLETTTRLAFHAAWMATLATAILHFHWLAAGIAFLVWILRFILQAIIVNKTAKDLNDRRRYYWSLPVFDVLQPLQSLRWKLYCLFRKKSEFLRK